MRRGWLCVGLVMSACKQEPADVVGPFGLNLNVDGVLRAGVAQVDITPEIRETFSDVNGDHEFWGCFDDPSGLGEGCNGEGFDDVDGDDWFDARFIGGFGYRRPAQGVRDGDGIDARAIVLTSDGQYLAWVALDLVGLGHLRINEAADLLEAEGFDRDRLIVASTHNHQGPDTMGLWGDPLAGIAGFEEAYQHQVAAAIAEAVRQAAESAVPVTLRIGAQRMRDRGPWFNGSVFGGHNPTPKMHGMVHDIRDPVVVSDQLLVVQAQDEADDTVFTLTNWSGHPEVRGGGNNELSADWVGATRRILEQRYGGIAVHIPECLGGMQSALGGDLPLVEADGTHVWETCSAEAVADAGDVGCFGRVAGEGRTYEDGLPVPVWAEKDSWDFVTSHGWHIAEAAIDILETAEHVSTAPIRVEVEDGYVPVRNLAYNLLGPSGIFDFGLDLAVTDTTLCPQAGEVRLGCLPFRTFRIQVGPLGIITAPGELLPELAWGLPVDDPAWVAEAAGPAARGEGSRYFPQHDHDCDAIAPEDCRDVLAIGDCDCLAVHQWPYVLGPDPSVPPVLTLLDTKYKAAFSMTSTYLSYIIPEPDVNRAVSLLEDHDGDHYEDTVTPAYDFATLWREAQGRIDARW